MANFKYASKVKQEAHDAKLKAASDNWQQVEHNLALSNDYGKILADPGYKEAAGLYYDINNTCPECGSQNTVLENHSMIWHDGDIVCADCRTYVRGWDAG
jgi:hypothetical protein